METTFAADTSKRTPLQWAKGLLILLAGLTIAHLGVTLFVLSNMGQDSFTTFVQGISKIPLIADLAARLGVEALGTCHVAICILLMVGMALTTRGYVKPGTVVCAFCGGWIIDLFRWMLGGVIQDSSPVWLRLTAMVLGCVILALGMSIVISSKSGTGPNDLIAIILTDKIRKVDFQWVRIACDVILVAVGWLLGGTVGVGTIVAAFLIGPVVQFFLPKSEKLLKKIAPDL